MHLIILGELTVEEMKILKIGINAGLILQQMANRLKESDAKMLLHEGVANSRTLCKLRVLLIRREDHQAEHGNTLMQCLAELGELRILISLIFTSEQLPSYSIVLCEITKQ